MKVIVSTVGRKGPDDESWNGKRLEAAKQAVIEVARQAGDVVILPAGYFSVRSSQAREETANSLIEHAKRKGIAIVFGIDEEVKNLSEDWSEKIMNAKLPFYGYAWSTAEGGRQFWRQRSINSNDQWLVPLYLCAEVRVLKIRNETIGVLMCGEIFNQRIRDALSEYSPRPRVIVDVAHVGQGFRVWQGMKKLAEAGLASVCSVHAQREDAMKYCYIPPLRNLSSRIVDSYITGPPRIELKIWTFE